MSDGAVIDLLLGAEVAATTPRTHPRHLVGGRADGGNRGGGVLDCRVQSVQKLPKSLHSGI